MQLGNYERCEKVLRQGLESNSNSYGNICFKNVFQIVMVINISKMILSPYNNFLINVGKNDQSIDWIIEFLHSDYRLKYRYLGITSDNGKSIIKHMSGVEVALYFHRHICSWQKFLIIVRASKNRSEMMGVYLFLSYLIKYLKKCDEIFILKKIF